MVAQYCEGRGPEAAEPYCSKVVPCWKSGFSDASCRPPQCPLHEPGCAFASICLNSEVLEQFAPKGASTATTAAAAAAAGASGTATAAGSGSSGSGSSVDGTASTIAEASEAGGFAAAARAKVAQAAQAAAATTVENGTTASGDVEVEVMSDDSASSSGQANSFQLTEDEQAQVQEVFDEEVIDPVVLAAARAASAAATGIGGGGNGATAGVGGSGAGGGGGRSGRGPRRRSLWDPDAAGSEAEAPPPPAAEVGLDAAAGEVVS